jgi:hypothetical protein
MSDRTMEHRDSEGHVTSITIHHPDGSADIYAPNVGIIAEVRNAFNSTADPGEHIGHINRDGSGYIEEK